MSEIMTLLHRVFSFIFFFLLSPAVKRLMKEAAELRDPTEHYHAQPLEVSFGSGVEGGIQSGLLSEHCEGNKTA